ncbi:hypothetical protein [uncultured Methanolobus sp.]|uniref:hypothetical protein n=1 Tax=uncultured Methanolobus sp. TaxID=218300 RepID=UPI002AAB7606|nr:hypothetical protein [uncultured Methanolobus sp.]
MKSFRDGTLKFAILNYVLHNSGTTSQDIAKHVQHESIKTLRSEIYYLKRSGYITVDSKTGTLNHYSTTKKGKIHAQDPHRYKRIKQERIQAAVRSILENDEQFSSEVQKEVRQRLSEIESGIREAPPIIETVETEADDSALKAELESKNLRIQELEAALQHLRLHKANVPTKAAPPEKSPEEVKKENERRQRREQLSMRYRGMLLDASFFHHWKDMFPFRMKHLQLYKSGSVEIMSPSNPEHRRGHARRPLSPNEIIGGKYHITKMTKAGIVIQGMGLPGGQASLRW